MPSPTALSTWLKDEMPRKGYPLAGPRAGGISRLADDADISRAALSRIMSGQAEPSLETLRALGRVLGYTLVEMLEFAGLIEPSEQEAPKSDHDQTQPSDGVPHIGADDWWVTTPPDDLWLGVVWGDLTLPQRWAWHTPNTTPETRYRMAAMVQWEREADVAAERYGRSLDGRSSDSRRDRGANGA